MTHLQYIGAVVAAICLGGCLNMSPSGPISPPTPPLTSQDIPMSPLGDLSPNMEYGQDIGGGTPQLDRPLSSYEKLSMYPAKKKQYDELNKKRDKYKKLKKEAEMERIGADIEIIKILKGVSGVNDALDPTPSGTNINSDAIDPLDQIKHLEWVKQKADIEADGLGTEIAKIERDMDKILEETNRSCFPPGTQIVLGDGSFKSIEEIVAGDEVMVYEIGKDQISTAPVTHIWEDVNNHFYILNEHIYATAYERFLTHDGWKKIRDIKEGEAIFNGNHFTTIQNKVKIAVNAPVFNLSVADSHNFFILPTTLGGEPILVHNSPGGHGGDSGGCLGGGK